MRLKCRAISGVILVVTLGLIAPTSAQQIHQSVALRAYLEPTVRVSGETLVLNFQLSGMNCGEITLPLDIAWNVDQFTTQFQIIASFSDSTAALKDSRGRSIAASAIEARFGGSPWKVFPETRAHVASSGLLLATIHISEVGRQAHKHIDLQFRLCGQQNELAVGNYRGRIDLRTIIR